MGEVRYDGLLFIMSLLHVIIHAFVQGITEFLPVSSSAHLALAPWLLGWEDQGLTFDIALHFGTLLAVLVYFFRDWVQIILQGLGVESGHDPVLKRNRALLWLIAVGSVPIGVFGLLLKEHAETTLRNPLLIGSMLVIVGILMAIADHSGHRQKGIEHVTLVDAVVIGVAQALAIVPGTSRSGITITAALFRDFERASAARFSFLLSTPAILGAGAKAYWDLHKAGGIPPDMRVAFGLGILCSALTGVATIAFFLQFLRFRSLKFFIYYRIVFGIIVIALAVFLRKPGG
jgi:undecaprenyl-diphosphatase